MQEFHRILVCTHYISKIPLIKRPEIKPILSSVTFLETCSSSVITNAIIADCHWYGWGPVYPPLESYDRLLISIDANSYEDTICILIAFSHGCFAYKYFGGSQNRSCPSFRGLQQVTLLTLPGEPTAGPGAQATRSLNRGIFWWEDCCTACALTIRYVNCL